MRKLFALFTLLCLSSCASTYQRLDSYNQGERIKSLVMHFTAIDYADSVEALIDEGGLSSHYLVPESNDPSYPYTNLRIKQLVSENKRAWHAGLSYWQGRNNLNDTSIGIEIVNVPTCQAPVKQAHVAQPLHTHHYHWGPQCDFPAFDAAQIELVIELSKGILARHPDIHPTAVVGHSDIAPQRKNDPGPKFPWFQLYQAGIGAWYEQDAQDRYLALFSESLPSIGWLQASLREYGYDTNLSGVYDVHTQNIIRAFQYHFLPEAATGQHNALTAATVMALLEKYFPETAAKQLKLWSESRSSSSSKELSQRSSFQIDQLFPTQTPSKRALVNDRAVFWMQQGQGHIHLTSDKAVSADIYINGELLNLPDVFSPHQHYQYSLYKRTVDGFNTLRVENVTPEDAQLKVQIDYPVFYAKHASRYDFSAVERLIQNDIEQGFPGAVLLVAQQGRIVHHQAYGMASTVYQTPMQLDTLFDLASNTKMFATVFALMHLVDLGDIELDAPVQQYLPEYTHHGREFRTIRQLLSHASGYPPSIPFYAKDKLADNAALYSQAKPLTELILTSKLGFTQPNGERATYSDINFMLLGMVIERVTGMPLDQFVETQLYAPLALHSLVFNPLDKGFSAVQCAGSELMGNTRGGRIQFDNIRTQPIHCEVHDEKAFYSQQGVAGHAGLFGTAKDVATLAQVLLNGGGYGQTRLFSPVTIAQFTAPSALDQSFGLGWRRNTDNMQWLFGPYASDRAFGHTGWTGTAAIIDPEHELVIVLLTNKRHSKVIGSETEFDFVSNQFETGRYGSIIGLIYEAVLHKSSAQRKP